jgi:hypothetical protein
VIDRQSEHLLAAGAALGDLEPDEAAVWLAHREGCTECRDLESELTLVLEDLALVVPERVPPPYLLEAVRRSIRAADSVPAADAVPAARAEAGSQGIAPVTAPASLDEARRRRASGPGFRRPSLALVGLAAAFAIAAGGFGARSLALQADLDRAGTEVAALGAEVTALEARLAGSGAVMATVMDPGHVTVALHAEPLAPAAAAMVTYVPGTSRAYLVADQLPATPAGHGYQLWYADAAGVHALQTVPFDGDGAFVAPLGVDLSGAAAVMVTLEDEGGATGEPGAQVIFGEI